MIRATFLQRKTSALRNDSEMTQKHPMKIKLEMDGRWL